MNEDKFWLSIWAIVGTVACVLIMTVGGCTAYTNKKLVEGGYVQEVQPGRAEFAWTKK